MVGRDGFRYFLQASIAFNLEVIDAAVKGEINVEEGCDFVEEGSQRLVDTLRLLI